MVIKVYVSGISASQEVRKKQQRVLFILESLKVDHEVVDITDPGKEEDRSFMREECTKGGKTSQLPPQIFSDQDYLGDYEDFEIATENEGLSGFLRLAYLESKLNNYSANNKQSPEVAQDGTEKETQQQNEGEPEAPSKLVNGNHIEDSIERDQIEGEGEESETAVVDSTESKEIGEGEVPEENKQEDKEEEEEEEGEEEEEEEEDED